MAHRRIDVLLARGRGARAQQCLQPERQQRREQGGGTLEGDQRLAPLGLEPMQAGGGQAQPSADAGEHFVDGGSLGVALVRLVEGQGVSLRKHGADANHIAEAQRRLARQYQRID